MNGLKYDIIHCMQPSVDLPVKIRNLVNEFTNKFSPIEKFLYVFIDRKTSAYYLECHLMAHDLVKLCTTNVPLDPDEQAEYRANREIVEDSVAFEKMKIDAKDGRSFSNIVAEFDSTHNPKVPIKIIGGQHRFTAISEAYQSRINVDHGLKIYGDVPLKARK